MLLAIKMVDIGRCAGSSGRGKKRKKRQKPSNLAIASVGKAYTFNFYYIRFKINILHKSSPANLFSSRKTLLLRKLILESE